MKVVAELMIALLTSAALPISATASAQAPQQRPSPTPAGTFDPTAAVTEVRRLIGDRYVLPTLRPALDAVLAEGLRTGRYKVSGPALFAERLSADLARVGQDKHLYFNYQPDRFAAMTARRPDNRPDPSAQEAQVRRVNHGIQEFRILPGNIRYLDLASWQWLGDESAAALNNAMAFLKDGDAVIIDVRRNGGGHSDAVRHVISHFMQAGHPLVTFYRGANASPPSQSIEVQHRMLGKPLYVLTSRGTGSASEEFAGNVAGYRLGELVGENTSGAAYMNGLYPIDGGFILSVSVARPVLGSTGKDWEATGVTATIPAPPEEALLTAQLHALAKLSVAATDESRRVGLEAIASGLKAALQPIRPTSPLQAYVGSYGDRTVSLEGSTLWYRQAERMRRRLVPLGGQRFTLMDDPSVRLDFQVKGTRISAFDFGPAAGPIQARHERTR